MGGAGRNRIPGFEVEKDTEPARHGGPVKLAGGNGKAAEGLRGAQVNGPVVFPKNHFTRDEHDAGGHAGVGVHRENFTFRAKPQFPLPATNPEEPKTDAALEANNHYIDPTASPAAPMAAPSSAALLFAVAVFAESVPP
jgi:hypothetical protein